jgi:hypothetical protein
MVSHRTQARALLASYVDGLNLDATGDSQYIMWSTSPLQGQRAMMLWLFMLYTWVSKHNSKELRYAL